MGVTVAGSKQLLAKFAKHKATAQQAADAAVYQRACQIMAASDSLVPVDTGRLRASHFVEMPQDGKVRLGYGTKYAKHVHEDLAAHHEHGQAKFLEHAMMEFGPDSPAWIAAKTIENIRDNVKLQAGAYPAEPQDQNGGKRGGRK